ncbi:MAG TPA: zinc ribbon domain-containing protein [Blastocatellia bacterium]|nr:zinc ribbon domain-containing protein [Blastocatellia bacterium]
MFCPSCGVESTNKSKFCKNCGTGLSQPGKTVEIHLPQPQVTGLFWAVGLFSLLGLLFSLVVWLLGAKLRMKELQAASLVCFGFVFLVTMLMTWQLGRLISTFRDSVGKTIKTEVPEIAIPAATVIPTQVPLTIQAVREPVVSVTEHTTRTFNPPSEPGPEAK